MTTEPLTPEDYPHLFCRSCGRLGSQCTCAVTWNEVAQQHPEFVQWIVAKFGPLPDGEVQQADYERFAEIYSELHPSGGEVDDASAN